MRVGHLISGDLWAGAEVQAFTLLKALKDDPEVDLSVIVLNEGRLARALEKAGIGVSIVDETQNSFFSIRRQIIRLLETEAIDILHSHRYKENILAAQVQPRCGIKHLVQTVHGIVEQFSGLAKLKAGMHAKMNRHFSRKCFDRIIAVSEDINDKLAPEYSDQQLVTIHNAINVDELNPSRSVEGMKKEFGLKPDRLVIGTAGRLVPVKGIDVLIKAAALIVEQNSAVAVLIAGDGPERVALEQQVIKAGLSDNVQLVGFRDDITDFLNCLDLFVMSSHHEGIPMVLLEAMALQKPVVSTDVGGVGEIVADGQSGLLVPAGDESALAETCLRLLKDPAERNRLGNEAKKRVHEEFSVDILKDRVINLYRVVMGQ